MIWKTAWKNVWRNRVRSLVVIISVTIGIFGGIFAVAVMNGAIEQKVDAALNQEIAHIHINHSNLRENYDIKLIIPELEEVEKIVSETRGVKSLASRTILTGMANTATKSAGVQILGVDPELEKKVLSLNETCLPGTGSFFEKESRYLLAYIGQDLAKELNIIRYMINEEVLDSLKSKQVPDEILAKLAPYEGQRFKSEKAFKKEMKSVLSLKEQQNWAGEITRLAWSFRQRSKMTLTFIDKNQVQTGAVFRIAGIYDINNNMFEKTQVLVKNEDLQSLTGMTSQEQHQMVIKLDNREQTDEVTTALKEALPELEVMMWKEIQPDLAMFTDMVQKFYTVFMVIILAALAFGIVNTMLMVVLERTKELGMLTAIGMNKKRVFNMIMLESVFLSLVGGVVGIVVSKIILSLTAKNGLNLAGYEEGFEALGFSAHIFPIISNSFFITVTILIIITGILSSIYPALKALRLNPVEALRTE